MPRTYGRRWRYQNSTLPNTGQGGARPAMGPTSNHSEGAMRFVVGHRNVRMPICSTWRCNTLWTYVSTWRLRGASIYRELQQRIAEEALANSC